MYPELILAENIRIPCGNFSFVLGASGHRRLHERCVALEQTLKSDYDAFALNYRLVLEELAICEETKRRIIASGMRYNEQTTRERITQEVRRGENGYTDLLIDLCLSSENATQIENIIRKQYQVSTLWNSKIFEEELVKYIRALFRFASKNAHSGEKTASFVPTNDLCRDYFRKLFYLICAYYGRSAKFDGNLLPFQDYYPIPKTIRETNGIILENRKQIYVRQQGDTLGYYLFVPADDNIGDAQKRDIETIHRLWMDNMDSPQNIVNNPTFVSNKNGVDYRFWVYPLPSFPQSLTDTYINYLDDSEKKQIVRGIVRGVASMHHAEPPFYHRALSPSAFLVCQIRNRPKPLLINFDCVKDTDEGAEYTVFYAVSDKLSDENMESIFAPELYSDEILDGADVDWAKVDVYALGKTITKILTNEYELPAQRPEVISEQQYEMLLTMCNEDIAVRPDIDAVSQVF